MLMVLDEPESDILTNCALIVCIVGDFEGDVVGIRVGLIVGLVEGDLEGKALGDLLGLKDGLVEGDLEGGAVGGFRGLLSVKVDAQSVRLNKSANERSGPAIKPFIVVWTTGICSFRTSKSLKKEVDSASKSTAFFIISMLIRESEFT